MRNRVTITSRPQLLAGTVALLGVVLAAAVAVGLGRVLSAAPGTPPSPGPSLVLHATPPLPLHTTRLEHGARHRPAPPRRRAKHHAKRTGGRSGGIGLRRAPAVAPAQVVPVIVPAPPPPSRVFLDDPPAPTPTATPSGPASGDTADTGGPSRGIPDPSPTPTATAGSTPPPLPGDD